MNKIYWKLTLAMLCLPFVSLAQGPEDHHSKCLAHYLYEQQIANDPQYAANQARLEEETAV